MRRTIHKNGGCCTGMSNTVVASPVPVLLLQLILLFLNGNVAQLIVTQPSEVS
jgi:hypothetical protein